MGTYENRAWDVPAIITNMGEEAAAAAAAAAEAVIKDFLLAQDFWLQVQLGIAYMYKTS